MEHLARFFRFLGLQAGDTRKLGIMGPVFFAGGVAELLSYTAFMALFNLRFGVQFLPIVYIIEAIILPIEGFVLSYIAFRSDPKHFKPHSLFLQPKLK